MRTVLFTGGGGAGNEALLRMFAERYDVRFADANPDAIAPPIPRERRVAIPMANDAGFAAALAGICRELGVDLLVPSVDEELPLMSRVAAAAPETAVLVPRTDYVVTMLDKLGMVRALEDHGLDAPRSETLDRAEDIGFPCIAKPRSGRGSRGVHVVGSVEQARGYLGLYGLAADEVVAQERLGGREFTVMMAADRDGELFAVVPVLVHVKRGITVLAETADDDAVIGACRAIHRALPTRGFYNIQCMATPDGRVAPFEINPRVSTTFCLALEALEVDPIAVFMGWAPRPEGLAGFHSGLRLRRFWYNQIGAANEP